MSAVTSLGDHALEERARRTLGASDLAIYDMVARRLEERGAGGELLVDVGCGVGNLWPFVRARFARCVGVDAVRYEGLPGGVEFVRANLNHTPTALPDACADVVASVETVEHLENPRAFVRELVRVARPGGWVVVTTPNQLSLLSLLTLVFKKRFSQFQDAHYPAHMTALLEVDLVRIYAECGLREVEVAYSGKGRVVLTPRQYPQILTRVAPRLFSDNLLVMGRKPHE